MAGAGIGICIVCGREGQALVSDICPFCRYSDWYDLLERPLLKQGQVVNGFEHGYKLYDRLYWVEEDFNGDWKSPVKLRVMGDNGSLSPTVIELPRCDVTYL